jgi:hypothetical protein
MPYVTKRVLKNWTDYGFYNFQEFFEKGAAKISVNYRSMPLKCSVSGHISAPQAT